MRGLWLGLAALSVLALVAPRQGGEERPGVLVTFAGGDVSDARIDRLVALYVPAGEAPTPFLTAGGFTAKWQGSIRVALRDRFTFRIEGNGRHRLRIGGAEVATDAAAKPVRLRKGDNAFELEYEAPAEGAACLRLLWSGSDFGLEPVPPAALSHDAAQAAAAASGAQLRQGRQLFADRQCSRCHAGDTAWHEPGAMPEVQRDAPSLLEAGRRLQPQWMATWIAAPRAQRRQAKMPHLLHGESAAQDARDLAAFLAQLGGETADDQPPPASAAEAAEGAALFAQLGCIGCHVLPGASPADPARIPLRDVRDKWRPAALVAFLQQPQRHYRWIAMPDFGLDAEEATVLAAFLRTLPAPPAPAFAGGDAARGKELAASKGCALCHELPVDNRLAVKPVSELTDWSRGCLADAPSAAAPDHGFAADERAALRAFAGHLAALGRCSTTEFAQRQRQQLRCQACHSLDGAAAHLSVLGGEVAELAAPVDPQAHAAALMTRPSLTWVGDKLRLDYLRRLLDGTLDRRARPWLPSRMPAFPSRSPWLAAGLAHEHGWDAAPDSERQRDPALATAGAELLPGGTGFGCNLCHGVGERPPMQVFEEQGVNLALVAERLRKPYFSRWLAAPARIQPSTRMPKYADERGRTALPAFGGDAGQQFEAIWQYLLAGRALGQ